MAVQTVLTLRRGGHEVFAIDRNPAAPAASVADGFAGIDFSDAGAVIDHAARIHPDIVLPVSDAGVTTAAAVNDALGLPGILPPIAQRYVSKARMRAACHSGGVRQPRFEIVRPDQAIEPAAARIGWPVVVKPSVNAGSRGVSVARDAATLRWSIDFARQHSPDGEYVVEEFIHGTEVTVEGLVRGGEVVILARSDKEHQHHARFRVAMSLNYPAKLTEAERNDVDAVIRGAVAALGAYDGAFHAECILGEAGAVLVEIHARGGGGHIFGSIVEAVTGVVMPMATVAVIAGVDADIAPSRERGACYRFFAPPPGRFVEAVGVSDARRMQGILDLGFEMEAGKVVGAIAGDADRPGYVVAEGATREEAMASADRAIAAIRFVVEAA